MKKYFALIILTFILVSCNKTENQTITETSKNIQENVVENNAISNTGEIVESGSAQITNSATEATKTTNNIKWLNYNNTKLGFSFSYPEKAYMETKCGSEEMELVDLKVFENGNEFGIGYSKKLDNCKLVTNTGYNLKFTVFDKISKKEEFVDKVYKKGVCEIEKTQKWGNTNATEIFVKMKQEIKNCIEKENCNDYNRFDCVYYTRDIFDEKLKKGFTINHSNADYFIAKYKTYTENMDKGSYDKEIGDTFKFY